MLRRITLLASEPKATHDRDDPDMAVDVVVRPGHAATSHPWETAMAATALRERQIARTGQSVPEIAVTRWRRSATGSLMIETTWSDAETAQVLLSGWSDRADQAHLVSAMGAGFTHAALPFVSATYVLDAERRPVFTVDGGTGRRSSTIRCPIQASFVSGPDDTSEQLTERVRIHDLMAGHARLYGSTARATRVRALCFDFSVGRYLLIGAVQLEHTIPELAAHGFDVSDRAGPSALDVVDRMAAGLVTSSR